MSVVCVQSVSQPDFFANNAADLVELRVKPLASTTAFRVTLSTLKDAERTAFTIALGNSPDLKPWPYRAGVRSPDKCPILGAAVHSYDREALIEGRAARLVY